MKKCTANRASRNLTMLWWRQNPWILASTANDMITFLQILPYIKLMKDISKVQEQVENERGKINK